MRRIAGEPRLQGSRTAPWRPARLAQTPSPCWRQSVPCPAQEQVLKDVSGRALKERDRLDARAAAESGHAAMAAARNEAVQRLRKQQVRGGAEPMLGLGHSAWRGTHLQRGRAQRGRVHVGPGAVPIVRPRQGAQLAMTRAPLPCHRVRRSARRSWPRSRPGRRRLRGERQRWPRRASPPCTSRTSIKARRMRRASSSSSSSGRQGTSGRRATRVATAGRRTLTTTLMTKMAPRAGKPWRHVLRGGRGRCPRSCTEDARSRFRFPTC